MRTIIITVCFSFIVSPAWAVLLMYEGFDYPVDSRIIGQTNPMTSQIWGDPAAPTQPAAGVDGELMVAGSVSYTGLPAATGNSLILPRISQSNIARVTVPGGPYTFSGANTSLFFSFTMKANSMVAVSDSTASSLASQQGDFIAGFTASNGTGGMSAANVYAGQFRIRREVDASNVQTGKYQLG